MMKKSILFAAFCLALGACQMSLEKQAARILKDYTEKNCPQRMSETVIMDSCRFEADTHTLHYFYRFTGVMDNDSLISARHDELTKMMVYTVKNDMSTRTYKEAGYQFQYSYFSEKEPQKLLFDIVLTKQDYQ